ncbi:GNAT family N-acetyltransferase [Flavobacterium cyanobacteriorum]|uniref:GNAT family N-acetyltransferase n=1 Tax=Flavobacterium cyanobacteriorum TaxID=2022802 RepID=A0A255YV84_9FLAO|nr:GNAT family N-acetyltransferase [Flavobacterium cyanobacteriorum]OYQ33147.1 GNAT family N-acetyltransferase [Flavobacterium cyanobacteriorum]
MILIKQIAPEETFAVRHPVLRPGKPLEACVFDGDNLPDTIHFGLYDDDNLGGVASLFKAVNPAFKEERQLQLRGMAVLPAYRNKGFGEKLVQAAEAYAISGGTGLIWFNAREAAVGFYEKMGYKKTGARFVIQDIGPHYVMYKIL